MSEPGPDELGAVDQARLQAGENLARRGRLRGRAEPAIDFAAESERADFQALHVVDALELAAEPAAHADAGIAAHERLHAERRIELVPQRLAAAGIDPGDVLVRRQTERHGRVEVPPPAACPANRTPRCGPSRRRRQPTASEHLEGRHHFARGVHGDLQAARRRARRCARRRAPPTCRGRASASART